MKIAKLQSMGGSGKQTAQSAADAEKVAAYKQRMQAHIDAIKRHISHYIERTTSPADDTCVTTALLELGIERRLDLHDEEDARDLTERTFRRVVKERRGPLQ
jgi:hypothetical protein